MKLYNANIRYLGKDNFSFCAGEDEKEAKENLLKTLVKGLKLSDIAEIYEIKNVRGFLPRFYKTRANTAIKLYKVELSYLGGIHCYPAVGTDEKNAVEYLLKELVEGSNVPKLESIERVECLGNKFIRMVRPSMN